MMMIRVVVVRLLLRSAGALEDDTPPGGGGRGRHSPTMVLVKDERDDRMEKKMHRACLKRYFGETKIVHHYANPKLKKTRVEDEYKIKEYVSKGPRSIRYVCIHYNENKRAARHKKATNNSTLSLILYFHSRVTVRRSLILAFSTKARASLLSLSSCFLPKR